MKIHLSPLPEVGICFWDAWDRLNTDCGNRHPLLQARLVKLLIEHFPADLEALSITENGSPAVLMLIKKPARDLELVRVGYLPAQSQIALVQTHSACSNLSQRLFQALPLSSQRFDLSFVDSHYQMELTQAKGVKRSTKALDMAIALNGDFKSYWNTRPRPLKKNIARYKNRARRELGDFRFEVIRAPEAIRNAVDRYGTLESEGWKGASGTALHPHNQQGQFYRALLHEYAATNEAIVFELYHQDRLVASRLTIHNSKMLVILKTTFDENYKRYAAGRILLYRVIEHLFAEKELEQIAFYTNATPEQLEWATASRPVYNISFYRYPFLASASELLRRFRSLRHLPR